jgi:hypothetical protein
MRDDLAKEFNETLERENKRLKEGILKPITELERQLLVAAEKGDAAKVADLIKKGANVFTHVEEPVILAAKNGHLEVVRLLVAEGSFGFMRYSAPLFEAKLNGHTEVVKFLEQAQDLRNKRLNALLNKKPGGPS